MGNSPEIARNVFTPIFCLRGRPRNVVCDWKKESFLGGFKKALRGFSVESTPFGALLFRFGFGGSARL